MKKETAKAIRIDVSSDDLQGPDEFGTYIDLKHELGDYPTIELYVPSYIPGLSPHSTSGYAFFNRDKNTIRFYTGPFNETYHFCIVG